MQSEVLGLTSNKVAGIKAQDVLEKASDLLGFLFGMQESEWEHQDYFGDAGLMLVSVFSVMVISATVQTELINLVRRAAMA